MIEPASDSSEDLYTLTTTTNIFDFAESPSFVGSETFATAKPKAKNFLQALLFAFSSVFASIFNFTFSLVKFIFAYFVYLKDKVLHFVHFLDVSKDKAVDTLMWRRGLLFRPVTHGGVIVVAAIAVVAGGLFSRGQIAAQDLTAQESVLKAANTSQTIVPTNRPRAEVMNYTVAGGDTLSTVAEKFGISVDTVKWANNITDDSIQPNQTLKIPPVTGVVYTVKAGDDLNKVAKTYSADTQTIADFPFNYIDDSLSLKVGQTLYIPNGVVPQPAKPKVTYATAPITSSFVSGSGFLSWPVPRKISQYFSWFHPALDLDDPYGTPIYAAHDGVIIDAQKQTYSFGWYCIESFGDGWTISYAHMSAQACYVGEQVSLGQYMGNIGMTGRATGPHLHFEVRHNGTPVDPLTLLK